MAPSQGGMRRSALTLLAGSALAQALPLLLGPWIARLYTPAEYGQFSLVWTVASNLAVVGCARYEFALALETGDKDAASLLALCLRMLLAMTAMTVLVGAAWMAWADLSLAAALPLIVLVASASQALSQWAARAGHFMALAWGRVVQWGGGALAQVGFGLLQAGPWGLIGGAMLATAAAAALQARPAPAGGWGGLLDSQPLRALAHKHRDFPLLNTPHAFAGALQDTLAIAMLAAWLGSPEAGAWALALRYLKAPASLVGGSLSQVLYPRLTQAASLAEARSLVRRNMLLLGAIALPLMLALLALGPWLFEAVFGPEWRGAGELARSLAPYIALHFIASPLSVVLMAWGAQAWGLKLALVGQVLFVGGLAAGLHLGGLAGAGWGVSAAMLLYFGYFFWALWTWE
ncbi:MULTISPECIES: lipopolysaccharide biosynthesis protein [unclassified Roseateles]|uniref:lipopolysaccharide biosynthesis protein n=1 Tax=unclassified Roseateles TaxID=2626991 RepID=UPI0006F87FB2|nr:MULTISPECIES: oligosaccharide flippase family protein [unclassified Roseateles]KQW42108.1 polysaccharide biosynthesis protein [Pelomonas sp. Root405]KRA67711.1 polysaccharide biosynthesis protein [Pelomonas sp. Root662]